MMKKPGILIGLLALFCQAVPLSVFADVPTISGLGLSVSYDDAREKYVFVQPKTSNINSNMGDNVYCNELTPSFLTGSIDRGEKESNWEVYNDDYINGTAPNTYEVVRSALLEVEFMHNIAAMQSMGGDDDAQKTVRQNIANALAAACVQDQLNQP